MKKCCFASWKYLCL